MDGTGLLVLAERNDAAMDAAINGLERRAPALSARRRVSHTQWAALLVVAAVALVCATIWPAELAAGIRAAAMGAFVLLIAVRVAAASNAAMSFGSNSGETPLAAPRDEDALPVYTVLCPLYREPDVAAELLAALARLDYPNDRLDVKLVTEADDTLTHAALRAAGLPNWAELVVTPAEGPRTKPKALNYALARARGEYVCVFDAEDAPDPAQLRAALAAFDAGGARLGCVQAPLTIANGDDAWIAQQFAAEYAIQFGQALPFYARAQAPFAIGGTSNHFRMAALADCGAWDPYNVTEDADLGFRLARGGWRMTMIAPPTIESAPTTLGAWIRQRTRWIKGHLQTWLVLMRDPVGVCRGMGFRGFAAMQAQLGGGLLASFAHGPFAAMLLAQALLPEGEIDALAWALAAAGYLSAAFGGFVSAVASRSPAHLYAVLTMPLYWPLASLAALNAVIELIVDPHYWAKTDHTPRAPCADPVRTEP
ncbi:MAG: glycosyltransferase [Alphaproteobacteria bacterium]|nr:glycosyltransferase [Alphaproteobacteria bacterium]